MADDHFPEALLLRLTVEQKAWLKAKAFELDRSMTSVLRRMIDLELRKAGKA